MTKTQELTNKLINAETSNSPIRNQLIAQISSPDGVKVLAAMISMFNTLKGEGGVSTQDLTEFPFKPRQAGVDQDCYDFADAVYSAHLVICSFITSKEIKAECEADAWIIYCDAFSMCVPA